MTRDRLLRWLEADRDGELRGWRRWWLRRALSRRPSLRAEGAALDAIRDAVRAAETPDPSPGLWDAIEPGLDAVDRERRRAGAERAERGVRWAGPALWWPAAAALGAAVLAGVLVWTFEADERPRPAEIASGHLRSLDTGGRAVWVQESEGATIIWLVGDESDAV